MSNLVTKATNNVVVTVENRKFVFEEKQLTENSLYFEKMFNGSYKESEQRKIVLQEVDAEEFKLFRDWVFGIEQDFRDLDCDILLRLVVLADRFLLNVEFRKECYKSIKFWLIRDVSFPMKVLETAMFIGDQKLKEVFINWLYGRELKYIRRSKWTLEELRTIYNVSLAFKEKRFAAFSLEVSKEVKEELNTLFNNHIQKIKNISDLLKVTLDGNEDRLIFLKENVLQIRDKFGENAEFKAHLKLWYEEFKRMNKQEIDINQLKIDIEHI